MVVGNTVNVCAVCNEELLTRAEVEALVRGAEELVLDRAHMRWDTYTSGSAFIFAEFSGVTGSRGEVNNVVCGCNVQREPSPSLMMIRSEFRDAVRAKFGDEFTVPFLFRIPATMVAWENSAFVSFEPSSDGLKLSADGTRLIEMIAEMSKQGLFRGGLSHYSETDVIMGFSYLHMVKPKYRSLIAIQFGSEITISDFFSRVTLEWLDWPSMAALSCSVVDGALHVYRLPGAPLVDTLFTELAKANVSGYRDFLPMTRSVGGGSSVTMNNTCFQVVPGSECFRGLVGEDTTYAVHLKEGHAFIPSGVITLRASKLAVTFEPGVVVEVSGGVVVQAPLGAVTMFIDGLVTVSLSSKAIGEPEESFNGRVRQFQVAVVCESYGDRSALAKWYKRRLDVTSTTARFFVNAADVVVLHHAPVYIGRGRVRNRLVKDGGVDYGDGVREYTCTTSGKFDEGGFSATPKMLHVLSGVRVHGADRYALVNGVVRVTAQSRVGLFGAGVVEFVAYDIDDGGRSVSPVGVRASEPCLTLSYSVIADEYVLDQGGPSDSDGFEDEMPTFVDSKASEALQYYVWKRQYPTYSLVARTPGNLVRSVGAKPTVPDILAADASLVDVGRFEDTGWRCTRYGAWEVVPAGQATLSWAGLARTAITWGGGAPALGTVLDALCRKYAVASVVPHRMSVCY